MIRAGPPGVERGAGASSNMTDFRSCEVQNGRKKCRNLVRNMICSPKKKKKRSLPKFERFFGLKRVISKNKKVFELHMLIFQCHFDGPPLKPMGPLLGSLKPTKPMGSLKSMSPEVIVPPSRRPWIGVPQVENQCVRETLAIHLVVKV